MAGAPLGLGFNDGDGGVHAIGDAGVGLKGQHRPNSPIRWGAACNPASINGVILHSHRIETQQQAPWLWSDWGSGGGIFQVWMCPCTVWCSWPVCSW